MLRITVSGLFCLMVSILTVLRVQAETPSRMNLVAENIAWFSIGRPNSASSRWFEPLERARQAFLQSGAPERCLSLITSRWQPEQAESMLKIARRSVEILGRPRWKKLLSCESISVIRIAMTIPDGLLAFRCDESSRKARREELCVVLEEIAKLAPGFLMIETDESDGWIICRLSVTGAPLSLLVAARDEWLVLTNSEALLAEMPRFESYAAFDSKSPGPGETADATGEKPQLEIRVEARVWVRYFEVLVERLTHDGQLASTLSAALEELRGIESLALEARVEGDRLDVETRLTFDRGSPATWCERFLADQEPIEHLLRHIPEETGSYMLSSGVDLARLYDQAVGFLRWRMPAGQDFLDRWDALQSKFGWRIRRDLLSWIEGGGGIYLQDSPRGSLQPVVLFRLRHQQRAERRLGELLARLQRFLSGRGQRFEYRSLEEPEGFYELKLEAFPKLRPVVGTLPGLLVLGGSLAAVQPALSPRNVKSPPDFVAGNPEGLQCLSRWDLGQMWQHASDLTGAAGFSLSVLSRTNRDVDLGYVLTGCSRATRILAAYKRFEAWRIYEVEARRLIRRWSIHR